MIPLYYQKDIELVKPYVHNLDDGLMGHLPYKNLTLAAHRRSPLPGRKLADPLPQKGRGCKGG